eukprot:CAMPEP_0183711532 /NCGR_PEP_ID=MMETSP0737-20130205/7016_1 /TAXON_ID=385413 /ORGANISM="Thalassiosira miniscula, Strain CCMP1093" /LENGTH=428 /DNA_ID=CAMNT_0025940067 /DNA_START=69 /DNA_END=1355 /DNA_ORIENTATION=+
MNCRNTSSIDALADIALNRDYGNLAVPPAAAVSPSLSLSSLRDTTRMGSPKMSDPNFLSTIASMRRSQLHIMAASDPINANKSLPNEVGSSTTNRSIYLSFLDEQRRRQSMADLERAAIGFTSTSEGISAMKSVPVEASFANPAPVRSQAFPAAAVSFSSSSTMQSQFDLAATAPSRRRKPNFSEKLHSVLSSKECRHAIAWLPSGRSFCITDQEEFVKKILPKFFREAKFESFSRRLKRWGFRKVYTTGLSQTIFSHDLFHRDRPDLCKVMDGRGNATLSKNSEASTLGNVPASPVGSVTAQDQHFHKMMMLQQANHQFALRQQMNPIQNSRMACLSPHKNIDTQAMINEAHTLVAPLMPESNTRQIHLPQDRSTIDQAKMHLTRLNDNIAQCEEQLAILQNLRELKERREQLTGTARLRGVSPSFV